ncbi:MAG TPA: vWA domain-containing protein, partial [Polyangiaceae bacterium]
PECAGLPFVDTGEEECVGIEFEAEPVPADLFIMMDRSSSQANTIPGTDTMRWDALRDAVQAFADEAAESDIRVGIGFFGRTGGRDDELDCDADYYAQPKVAIGPLSEVGADLVEAIADQRPSGLTPTGPALEGAHRYAAAYAAENPQRSVSVVLVTDGFPTQCSTGVSVSDLADMAEEARGNEPYVRTFVIGLEAEGNLNTIARAGGTSAAYLVDEGDVTASFRNALRNITNSQVPCRFEIPEAPTPGQVVDPEKVQVAYWPASGDAEEIPRLGSADACSDSRAVNGGWYYDNNSEPRNILVCPCTCSRFGAGQVDIRLGCEPRIGIR